MSKKYYPYIDIMRIIAAILVVGIHTYPFLQISPSLDFLITHIIGRIAVPFFFMTTSFFLFRQGVPSVSKLISVLKQFLMIDIICILIYLPIQIYNQSFSLDFMLILKDVFMNGTFYHLWYLPASMIGIAIIYLLLKYLKDWQSFIIVLILYVIGLGGDSYYGLTTQIPLISDFYSLIFQFCDYTRNGIFFAPMFLWLGGITAMHPYRIHKQPCFMIVMISFLLMSLEALILNHYQIPRHDAMFITLPIVMFLFFMFTISFRGRRYLLCKDLSLYVYIIHPFMIVVMRLLGKLLHLENYFIDNSLIHFLLVLLFSFIFSYLCILIKNGGFHNEKSSIR